MGIWGEYPTRKDTCYKCGNYAYGRVELIDVDDKHDETYHEFFCYECLGEYDDERDITEKEIEDLKEERGM